MSLLITIINATVFVLTILVFVYSLLGYFLDRYHPVRNALGQIVEPMLAPIRRLMPSTGGIDLSPLVLIILLQVIEAVLVAIIRSLG